MGRIQCSKQKRNEIYEILTEINNSAKSQNQLTKIYNTIYVADKNKVLWETSVGWKRKLILYPSKKKEENKCEKEGKLPETKLYAHNRGFIR